MAEALKWLIALGMACLFTAPITTVAAEEQQLEAVVVSGLQPGPGLWQVRKGDHVLWVLGTLEPLPRDIEWETDEAALVIGQSQQVLLSPVGKLSADVGFFGGLALLPTALGARKNPDKRTLSELMPAELHARWELLKRQYLGRGRGIEKKRPLLAANKLYSRAIARNGMTLEPLVDKQVQKLAKRARVAITRPTLAIRLDDTRSALKEVAATDLDDLRCFEETLDRLEQDLDTMRDRANAWAVGDIEALAELPFVDQRQSCANAILSAAAIRERGLEDLPERMGEVWLEAAEAALAVNRSTFAVLPMRQLLATDGYLSTLQARGYEVVAPALSPPSGS